MAPPDPEVVRTIEESLSAAIKVVITLDISASERPRFIGRYLLASLDGTALPTAPVRPAPTASKLVAEMPALAKICTDGTTWRN